MRWKKEQMKQALIFLVYLTTCVFQDASLVCIFSIKKRKSLLFALPLRIGKPKYLSRKVVLLILEIEASLLILTLGTPEE